MYTKWVESFLPSREKIYNSTNILHVCYLLFKSKITYVTKIFKCSLKCAHNNHSFCIFVLKQKLHNDTKNLIAIAVILNEHLLDFRNQDIHLLYTETPHAQH